ncbi:MAG: helix-turn-helix domain-containing protein [Polyangiaceae bacterium]
MPDATPKQIRKAARLSLIAAAVGAGVSETTCRVYEASRDAVSDEVRARLDAYYKQLAARGSPPTPSVHPNPARDVAPGAETTR